MPITSISSLVDATRNATAFTDAQSTIDDGSVEKLVDSRVVNEIGGEVEINEISIITKAGNKISLLDVYDGFVVHEKMFNTSISGAIRIKDVAGGLEKFMLRGGETLTVKISKRNNGGIIIWREDLIVSRIGAGDHLPQTGMTTYALYFYSASYINSAKKNLFKSYKNQPISSAVVDLYTKMSVNDLFIEDPRVTLERPFICTGISPHRAIDRLAQRACSKNKYFVFFERFIPIYGTYPDNQPFSTSHYFGSVEKIIEDASKSQVKTIAYTKKINANREPVSYIRAINLRRNSNFNHIPGMLHGFYNTTISTVNPINRTVSTQKMSYTDKNQPFNDIYENRLIDDANIFANYDDINYETPGRKVIVGSINDSVPRETWVKNHMFGEMSKTYFQINVDIEGGTNQIGVGHIVNFILPSVSEILLNNDLNYTPIDLIYSGKYLVTGVSHGIKTGKYIKTLELSRGSSPIDMNSDTSYSLEQIEEIFGNRRIS